MTTTIEQKALGASSAPVGCQPPYQRSLEWTEQRIGEPLRDVDGAMAPARRRPAAQSPHWMISLELEDDARNFRSGEPARG
jgi:hypothetical protein